MCPKLAYPLALIVLLAVADVHRHQAHAFINFKSFGNDFRPDLQTYCPQVKAMRNFDIAGIMGFWYVIEYYASSEEMAEYSCMKCNFSMSAENAHITMNFTYLYRDDPDNDILYGNITWAVPNTDIPAHWIHAEDTYEGVYNTYIIDTDYQEWALLMHCAEKERSNRYLSALMLSRTPTVPKNVKSFLREKLPPYDIDISFMFPIVQENCERPVHNYAIANLIEPTAADA